MVASLALPTFTMPVCPLLSPFVNPNLCNKGTRHSSDVRKKIPGLIAPSHMLVKAHVHAVLKSEPSSLRSPKKAMKDELQMVSLNGSLVQDGLVYRQNMLIRSFEIGSDGRMSLVSLISHLQDTALNHGRSIGLVADCFGSTPEMRTNNLTWVVSSLKISVDCYPSWDDFVQVDAWMYASGKNSLGRDWLFRDLRTGETLARATSVFRLMNKKTRKLSKFMKEVREEIAPHFKECDPIIEKDSRKIQQLDIDSADYVRTGLTPGWNDMDVNQHVNHVKYLDWILQSTPRSILESYSISTMTLEYRKECNTESVLQSLSKHVRNGTDHSTDDVVEFEHSLRLEDGSEILRGRTFWKPKDVKSTRVEFDSIKLQA